MKLKKNQQEFIKRAYNDGSVCQDYKNRIKEHFPKLFKEEEFANMNMEEGKWYLSKINGCLVRYIGENKVQGFFRKGTSWDEWDWPQGDYCLIREAKPSEIKDALLCEANSRGFKDNVLCLTEKSHKVYITTEHDHEYRIEKDMFYYRNALVYKQGNWGSVPTITKKEAEKQLKTVIQ